MRRSIMIVVASFVAAVAALWLASSPPPASASVPDVPKSLSHPGEAAPTPIASPVPDHAYSRAEVARHATAQDCWIIVHGVVYDVTSYIDLHPAPPDTILRYAGGDATTGWDTKGKDQPHSARAERMLQRYRIGILKDE